MARKKAVTEATVGEIVKITDVIGTVNARNGLNVRKEADIKSSVLTILRDGEKVVITGESGDWWQTATGYVMKKFIDIDE